MSGRPPWSKKSSRVCLPLKMPLCDSYHQISRYTLFAITLTAFGNKRACARASPEQAFSAKCCGFRRTCRSGELWFWSYTWKTTATQPCGGGAWACCLLSSVCCADAWCGPPVKTYHTRANIVSWISLPCLCFLLVLHIAQACKNSELRTVPSAILMTRELFGGLSNGSPTVGSA